MSDLGTAEILEFQVAMLELLQSQAAKTMLSQATISKRQLLNFVANVDEFVKDFMAVNQRTINMIRKEELCQEQKPDTIL